MGIHYAALDKFAEAEKRFERAKLHSSTGKVWQSHANAREAHISEMGAPTDRSKTDKGLWSNRKKLMGFFFGRSADLIWSCTANWKACPLIADLNLYPGGLNGQRHTERRSFLTLAEWPVIQVRLLRWGECTVHG